MTTNLLNGKVYIGQRKGQYRSNYFGGGVILKKAMKKYGVTNFGRSVIAYAPDREGLNRLENTYITECRNMFGKDNVYNIAEGGLGYTGMDLSGKNNPMFGKKHRSESIQKMKDNQPDICGENNPRYVNGYTLRPNFCSCGKQIHIQAKHCRHCAAVLASQKRNSERWNDLSKEKK